MKKSYLYAGIGLLGFGMFLGGIIANIIFFGILTAGSLIFLVQSNRGFKMFVGRFGFILDLILFVLSAFAVATLGVTIAGGLGVASLIFTVYRVSFLAPWYKSVKKGSETLRYSVAKTFNDVYDYVSNGWTSLKSLFVSKSNATVSEAVIIK